MKKRHLLLSLLLAPSFLMAQEQEIRLTTSRATGETLTLQVNRLRDGLSVDWGDGNYVSYSRTEAPLITATGTLKGQTVVIKGGEALNTLICENAGITAADVKGATSLRSLYLQNNELTSIDVTALAALTDLDLSGNKITTLALSESKNPVLENVNLANNGMEKIGSGTAFVLRSASLQHVNVSGNHFKNVYTTNNTNLDALFCSGNDLEQLNVSRATTLSTIVCNDNKIKTFTMPTDGLAELRQLVCDNNAISSLDLTASKNLTDISCANNGLTSLVYPSLKLNSLSVGGNALTFRALPIARNQPDAGYFSYLPQADFDVTSKLTKSTKYDGYYLPVCPGYSSRNTAEYILDLSDYRLDGSGRSSVVYNAVSIQGDDTEVVLVAAKASDPEQDYTQAQGKLTFLKEFGKVRVLLTHPDYPDLTLRSSAFVVGEENISGINSLATDAQAADAETYDLQGRRVKVQNGLRPAQRGIFIQGGKKVLF